MKTRSRNTTRNINNRIRHKKSHGQHFLRDASVVHAMLREVDIDSTTSVFEIGCGDGFLTRRILKRDPARLWVFEVDKEWADYVQHTYDHPSLHVFNEDFLTVDFSRLEPYKPWIVLANLPYNITFPILHVLQEQRHLISEGVIMVQDEVAQKIIKTHGRGYGFPSLLFQHYFSWKLLRKVQPQSFYPQPNVTSRLMYFQPIQQPDIIPQEDGFWEFVYVCFKQPRRTLRNNLKDTDYDFSHVSDDILKLRAQQMDKQALIDLWKTIIAA